MKKIISLICGLVLSLSASVLADAQVKKVTVTEVKLLTVNPLSLTSADGAIELTIVNSTKKDLKVSDINATISQNGQLILTGTADKFTLKKETQTYTLKYKAELSNPMQLLSLIQNRALDSSALTADVNLKVAVKKKAKPYSLKGVRLKDLMK